MCNGEAGEELSYEPVCHIVFPTPISTPSSVFFTVPFRLSSSEIV